MDQMFKTLAFWVAVVFVIGAACILYDFATAETFSLRKSAWACTASHVEVQTTMVLVGKVVVPQASAVTVCDRWERR